jgi:hypothetical protein
MGQSVMLHREHHCVGPNLQIYSPQHLQDLALTQEGSGTVVSLTSFRKRLKTH